MKEPEMGVIADLFKKCLMEGKYVGDEVTKLRQDFQTIHYAFDHLKSA